MSPMTIRQTAPTVTTVAGSASLINGENPLMTVIIAADAK